ncbi:MAG: hypothetical protein HQ477_00965 [Chloroflexi bacterium]|nr:hypothetical protein [Chloroflexota bacterium]
MKSLTHSSLSKRLLPIFLTLMILITMSFAGCWSSKDDDELFSQISDPGQVLTLDDLLATQYKESSSYSTEGLPGATDVSFGFLRVGSGDPYDYEVRFYESHKAANDQGTAMVIEGFGKNAILREADAIYKAGVKNRRTIIGGGESVGGGIAEL